MTAGSSSSGKPAYLDEKGWRYAQSCGWPLSAITDPGKFPKIVETREDFIRELMCGDHVHEVVIFRNGLKAFGLDKSIEKPIQDCIDKSKSMQEFLLHMRNLPDIYKARFCYDNKKLGRQKEVGAGDCKRTMFSKLDEIAKDHSKFPGVYVAELRRNLKYTHPATKDEQVKTVMTLDVKDVLPDNLQQFFPYWDRYDEGIFIGDNQTGKCLHVDQVLWSNIGKNFTGYKIAAAWPFGQVGNHVLDDLGREVFKKPLDSVQARALEKAAKVVVLQPGDLFFFCGGIPHTTLCISDELNVTCYESIVTPAPAHVALFLKSGFVGKNGHHEDFAMPFEEFKDLLIDVQERLEDGADAIEDALEDDDCENGRENVAKHFGMSMEVLNCFEECFERFACHKKFLADKLAPTRKTLRTILQSKLKDDEDFVPASQFDFEIAVADCKLNEGEEKEKDNDAGSASSSGSARSLSTASESDSDDDGDESRERFRGCAKSDTERSPTAKRGRSCSEGKSPVSKKTKVDSTAPEVESALGA